MSHHHTLVEGLKDSGFRLTPQRDMILTAIHDSEGHFTAEQVFQQIHAQSPAVNLATVYRTLELLAQIGIITEIDLGGTRREYELSRDEPHHHLACRYCGATLVISHDFIRPLVVALRDAFDFSADLEHLSVFGTCAHCRERDE